MHLTKTRTVAPFTSNRYFLYGGRSRRRVVVQSNTRISSNETVMLYYTLAVLTRILCKAVLSIGLREWPWRCSALNGLLNILCKCFICSSFEMFILQRRTIHQACLQDSSWSTSKRLTEFKYHTSGEGHQNESHSSKWTESGLSV